MIPELGHFALILALPLALAQIFIPDAQVKIRAALLVFGLSLAAFLSLIYAYVTSDFSLANVIENSHSAKPLLYKIAGAWGNHEGSMILWMVLLSLFSALFALRSPLSRPPLSPLPLPARGAERQSRDRDKTSGEREGGRVRAADQGGRVWGISQNASDISLTARVLSVQGALAAGFLAFILFTSNPFIRVPFPMSEGFGLNPVLQHPALAIHPPLLYMGYVGFSVAFAFAIAGLREGRIDSAWAARLRPWVMISWTALSAGIALGSWWAYEELGWGGWWFWDPVENASLMPWLLGTALLHSVIVLEKRGALARWSALLAILTFSLALLGTFLVRSGVLTSVHAFATDPLRGLVILVLLACYTGGALLLYGLRAHRLESAAAFSPLSRESFLIFNNLFMVTGCATVIIGTLYPLLMEAVRQESVAVGPPYFEATFVPLMVPAIMLMALAPFVAWKKSHVKDLWARLRLPFGSALLATGAIYYVHDAPPAALLGFFIAMFLLFATLAQWAERVALFKTSYLNSLHRALALPREQWAMSLAHGGLAIAILGMIGSTIFMEEKTVLMAPGDRLSISRYELKMEEIGSLEGPNYVADAARLVLTDGSELMPERRYYPAEEQATTEAAIRKSFTDDLYVALGEKQDEKWIVRAYVHPLIPYLWLGFALIILGGIFGTIGERRK